MGILLSGPDGGLAPRSLVLVAQTYTSFLKGLRLRHFAPQEITSYASRPGNSLPPRELWTNLVPTLWVVDQLRETLNQPIVLTSIYRNPDYNRRCGGALRSQHMRNSAIDLYSMGGATPRRIFTILKAMRDARAFSGGLGLYTSFVHIDTRGNNSTWNAT